MTFQRHECIVGTLQQSTTKSIVSKNSSEQNKTDTHRKRYRTFSGRVCHAEQVDAERDDRQQCIGGSDRQIFAPIAGKANGAVVAGRVAVRKQWSPFPERRQPGCGVELVDVDADALGIRGVHGVFGIDERADAARLLGLGDDVVDERGLTGGLRPEHLDHTPAREPADAKRKVKDGAEREMNQIRRRADQQVERLEQVWDRFKNLKVQDLEGDEVLYREMRDGDVLWSAPLPLVDGRHEFPPL